MKRFLLIFLLLLCPLVFTGCGVSFGTVYPDGESYSSGNIVFTAEVSVSTASGDVTVRRIP